VKVSLTSERSELGFGQIFTEKVGFGSLGMVITDRKTIELGLGFLKFGKTIGWEMGSGQNLSWENGIYTLPLQDPPIGCKTRLVTHAVTIGCSLHENVAR